MHHLLDYINYLQLFQHQVHNQPGYEGLLINFSSGEEFDQLRNGIVVMRLVREF